MNIMIVNSYVPSGNARIYYQIAGSGKPLILLHAGIADKRMWQNQIEALADTRQVITLDFRGYGKSTDPKESFHHFHDVYNLIIFLGLNNVDVMGCSLGGLVALEMAVHFPELIDKLILVAPGLRGYNFQDGETLAKTHILAQLILENKKEEAADLFTDIWITGNKRKYESVNPLVKEFVRRMILDNYDAVVTKRESIPEEDNLVCRLGDIKHPALIIVGEMDNSYSINIANLLVDTLPHATLFTVPDASHLPNLEKRELFNHTVMEFLSNPLSINTIVNRL
ncbi:MAG: alpha/beta hydrolase [Dehalococcoidales bacterium]|nr:alpha/beta hydrolase [Dehalococcoidales bacterium]